MLKYLPSFDSRNPISLRQFDTPDEAKRYAELELSAMLARNTTLLELESTGASSGISSNRKVLEAVIPTYVKVEVEVVTPSFVVV